MINTGVVNLQEVPSLAGDLWVKELETWGRGANTSTSKMIHWVDLAPREVMQSFTEIRSKVETWLFI